MVSSYRVPKLVNPNIVVRWTTEKSEIEQANKLVFRNYVAAGFWEDNEDRWRKNKYLHTPARHVFVMKDRDRLLGTMSIIVDSPDGLPSDSAQPGVMRDLRARGGSLAEVSAFAMDRAVARSPLFLYLISYMFQFSFYYAGVDRLVASCGCAHADFYEAALCFSKVSGPTYYRYTHDVGCLLTLDLIQAHGLFSRKHPAHPVTGESFYRFILGDGQPCHVFPLDRHLKRPREINWIERGLRKVA
ncbi:MAG: N-acyl amino acid synthase FeeM domain-containing protein [Sulfurifustis sp.]